MAHCNSQKLPKIFVTLLQRFAKCFLKRHFKILLFFKKSLFPSLLVIGGEKKH